MKTNRDQIRNKAARLTLAAGMLALAGCTSDNDDDDTQSGNLSHTLYVAYAGGLSSFDIATGEERPGEITDVQGGSEMQALDNGVLLVNLTTNNQILAFDGKTMLERARLPSSAKGAVRPVHTYLTPKQNGKQYWMTLNDGDGTKATNSARFLDVVDSSSKFLQAVGEVSLGIGHHKAAFSTTKERVVISNIGDCDALMTVFDYSDIGDIKALATLSAADAGFDGSSRTKTCDQTRANGISPSPHGCATAKSSGKAYCNVTGSGQIAAVDLDAATPTFSMIPTAGTGGGYTAVHPEGRYVYSVQGTPREGSGGAACQIGQIAVIDATSDKVVKELPLFYKGPTCTDSLAKTDEASSVPDHVLFVNGKAYVKLAGGFGNTAARVRQQTVLDVANPADPKQLASVPVGASTSHHGEGLSGDGKYLFVANNVDNSVTQIETATGSVVRTIPTKSGPSTVATYGSDEGPGYQTGPIH